MLIQVICKSDYIKPFEVLPVDRLVKPVKSNFVLGSGWEASVDIFVPDPKWDLLPPPVIQEREQTHARHEEHDDRQDTPQGGKQSPGQDNKLGGGLTQTLLEDDELSVQDAAGEHAPGDGDVQELDRVDAKGALVLLERCGREDAVSSGGVGEQDQEDEDLKGHLDERLKS